MLKRDLFVAAMQAGHYKKIKWLIGAFSIVLEGPTEWQQDAYAYRIVATPLGIFYCNPDNVQELLKVEDGVPGQALYRFKEKMELQPLEIPNYGNGVDAAITTSYGNLFFNWAVLVHAFGTKIEYHNPSDKVKVGKIEDIILERLHDDPKPGAVALPGSQETDGAIYISEYLKFAEGMFYLTSMTQLCTYGATEKVLLPPPGIKEFKAALLAQYADKLEDKATIAKIDEALIKFDAEYLKGDEAENFLIDDKSRSTVRRKLFLMAGAETGLDENSVKADLIQNSLLEGWDISKFPSMNNSLRAGSFNRGSQTQLGGVSVKWLLRASSNMNVTLDDCGSRLGNITLVSKDNLHRLVGFSMVTQEGSKRIKNKEEAGAYLGKKLLMRSPMYCKLTKTDYCKVCVGERLTVNPDGLSIAVSDYGSAFLAIYMKAMHGKNLQTAKMDLATALF